MALKGERIVLECNLSKEEIEKQTNEMNELLNKNRIFYATKPVEISEEWNGKTLYSYSLPGMEKIPQKTIIGDSVSIGELKVNQTELIEDIKLKIQEAVEDSAKKILDNYQLIYHIPKNSELIEEQKGLGTYTKKLVELAKTVMKRNSEKEDSNNDCVLGLFPSKLEYNIPVDGNCTESLTLQEGKMWMTSQDEPKVPVITTNVYGQLCISPEAAADLQGWDEEVFDESERWTITEENKKAWETLMENAKSNGEIGFMELEGCPIPIIVNDFVNLDDKIKEKSNDLSGLDKTVFQSCIQNVDIKKKYFELGKKGAYHRYIEFPAEVRTDIEVYSNHQEPDSKDSPVSVYSYVNFKKNPENNSNIDVLKKMNEVVVPTSPYEAIKCTCCMDLLLSQGCQCGAILKEKENAEKNKT